jgi:hypothetical protein
MLTRAQKPRKGQDSPYSTSPSNYIVARKMSGSFPDVLTTPPSTAVRTSYNGSRGDERPSYTNPFPQSQKGMGYSGSGNKAAEAAKYVFRSSFIPATPPTLLREQKGRSAETDSDGEYVSPHLVVQGQKKKGKFSRVT